MLNLFALGGAIGINPAFVNVIRIDLMPILGDDGGVVVDRMLNASGNIGFDAARKEYVDLFEAGIIDPAKVVRMALENAVSVASVLLLTEATMTEKPEKREERLPAEAPT